MNLTKTAGASIVGLALIVGTAGMASAATKPTAAPGAAKVAATASKATLISPAQRAQLRAKGHIEVVKHTKRRGDVTLVVQRGEITALSATSITLQSKDGFTHSYTVAAATKVRERRQEITVTDLKVGERAMVVAARTPKGDVARRISCVKEARKAGKPKATVAR